LCPAFNSARGYSIERENYLQDLLGTSSPWRVIRDNVKTFTPWVFTSVFTSFNFWSNFSGIYWVFRFLPSKVFTVVGNNRNTQYKPENGINGINRGIYHSKYGIYHGKYLVE